MFWRRDYITQHSAVKCVCVAGGRWVSPHLRRVELVNVGTLPGCSSSLAGVKNLFDRGAKGSRARGAARGSKVYIRAHGPRARARECACYSKPSGGRRNQERHQMIRTSLSNRAQSEMSRTVCALSKGKRDD